MFESREAQSGRANGPSPAVPDAPDAPDAISPRSGLPPLNELPAAVAALASALDNLGGVELWQVLDDAELLMGLGELSRQVTRAQTLRLDVLREVEQRGCTLARGATSTAGWLRSSTGIRPGTARRDVILATALHDRFPTLRAALGAGEISVEAAEVIVRAIDSLPSEIRHSAMPDTDTDPEPADVTEEAVTVARWAEDFLIEKARVCDPAELGRLGQHLHAMVDPDVGEKLAKAEDRAIADRQLRLSESPRGGLLLRGHLDPETGLALRTALDAYAAPHPQHTDGGRDLRTPAQRHGDALALLLEGVLDGGGLPTTGGVRPHLNITIPYATLAAGLKAEATWRAGTDPADGSGLPRTDWGAHLSPATVRRLACDAQIIPVVLGSKSEPLDVGRSSYAVPTPMRRALIARDRGCAFPGCQRPPSWTHAHHIHHWSDGGDTKLSNLVLLCSHHHRHIHHSGWTVRINDEGHPEFVPPPWIDPTRTPRPADHRRQTQGLVRTGHDPPRVG